MEFFYINYFLKKDNFIRLIIYNIFQKIFKKFIHY